MVKKHSAGHNKGNKEKLSVPSKEIKIDKIDSENMMALEMELNSLIMSQGRNRRNFLKAEKILMAKMDAVTGKMQTTEELVKKKYKVIGKFKKVDYDKCIIFLE